MSYSHLSIVERGQLQMLLQLGLSLRAIGKHLNRYPSTIAREVKRSMNDMEFYHAPAAQQAYEERRRASKPKGRFTTDLKTVIEAKLNQTWSPEQIAERHRAEGKPMVCFKTIYRWLYEGRLACTLNVTKESVKSQRRHEDASVSEHLLDKDLTTFENEKTLDIGNWTPWFLAEGKAKRALPPSSSVKLDCT